MSVPPYEDPGRTRSRPKVDGGRLWTGGVATAAVAALVAVVGVLIARALFEVPLLAPAWPVLHLDHDPGDHDCGDPAVPDRAEANTKLATAALNAVVGTAIGSLVSSVARSAVRVARA
jgi:hypothetical protein